MKRIVEIVFLVLAGLAVSLTAAARLLVVAPHPDDDVIIASGQLYRAVQQGEPFRVVFITNGDLDGVARGYARQDEAIAALSDLGVAENNAVFLGYPDAHLASLFYGHPDEEDLLVTSNGVTETYGARGLGFTDYHSFRFGEPADYNGASLISDLADLIADLRPDQIILTSEYDTHPDHATAFAAVVAAANSVRGESPDYSPVLYKTIVWTEAESSWPQPIDPSAYTGMPPGLYATPLVWTERTSLDQPARLQETSLGSNLKYRALLRHNDGPGLLRYIHKDEFYWAETLDGASHAPVVDAGSDQTAATDELVQLDGTGSRDPDGQPLSYRWVQREGTPVQLSDSTSAAPVFTAPSEVSSGEVLDFELVVSDGDHTSLADSVRVLVMGSASPEPGEEQTTNVAPLATATASSDNAEFGQVASKAIDGIVDGYPGDYTREWASAGERTGAWLGLSWEQPHVLSSVVLYDRPNSCDQVVNGRLRFSDGSTIETGALDNLGGPTTITFPARVTLGLEFSVLEVSGCTQNVGLSEFAVFGVPTETSEFSLATQALPAIGGVVSTSPAGDTFSSGTGVAVTAVPASGYLFSHWSGDAAGSANPTTVLMTGDRGVVANFVAIPASLSVTPSTPLTASGPQGGSFSPDQAIYVLQNGGGASLEWSAAADQTWVDVSPAGGTLLPGELVSLVVTLGEDATVLEGGAYAATVSIVNLTNGNGSASRTATLEISSPSPDPVPDPDPEPDPVPVPDPVPDPEPDPVPVPDPDPEPDPVPVPEASSNIAPLAMIAASSEAPTYGQTAVKVADGVVDGYPGDYTREWATANERVGAWLELSWDSEYLVDRVVLYDRPNTCDHIVGGVVLFSDGSSMDLGALDDWGGPTEFEFDGRAITDLTFMVTAAGPCTQNVGLSEIEVFGTSAAG